MMFSSREITKVAPRCIDRLIRVELYKPKTRPNTWPLKTRPQPTVARQALQPTPPNNPGLDASSQVHGTQPPPQGERILLYEEGQNWAAPALEKTIS